MNSNWVPPGLSVQYAPGYHPLDMPADGEWVTLAIGDKTRLRSYSKDRGRQDDLGEFEASTATVVLDNTDGQLDQLRPGSLTYGTTGAPLTPVRVQGLDGATGITHTLYTGFVLDGWEPVGTTRTRDAKVTVNLTDWIGWASTVPLPASTWATWVQAATPLVWWRGSASTTEIKWSGGKATGVVWDHGLARVFHGQPWSATSYSNDVADPLVPGESDPGWQSLNTRLESPFSITDSDDWTVTGWFAVDSPDNVLSEDRWLAQGRTGSASGLIRWGIRVETTGQLTAIICNSAGTVIGAAQIASTAHKDGNPHVWVAYFTQTSVGLTSDLGFAVDFTLTDTPAGGGGFLLAGSNDANQHLALMDELAYWPSLVDIPQGISAPALAAYIDDTTDDGLWYADSVVQRVAHLAGLTHVDPARFETTFGAVVGSGFDGNLIESYTPPADLGAAIRELGSGILGAAWMTRDGITRIRDAEALTATKFHDSYGAVAAVLTDEPTLPTVGPPGFRYLGSGRTGARLDRVINEVKISWQAPVASDAGFFVARDRDSQDRYGIRGKEQATTQMGPTPGIYTGLPVAADLTIQRYGEPPIEIGAITIKPWGDPAMTTFALSGLELERAVMYVETAPGETVPLHAGRYWVQSESWVWADGTSWEITMTLAPTWMRPPEAPKFAGNPLVARSLRWPATVHPGATTAVHTRMRVAISRDCASIRPVFPNIAYGHTTEAIVVRWSLDQAGNTPVSAASVELGHFAGEDGNRDVTIAPGDYAVADPIAGPFVAGDVVWINTRVAPVAASVIGAQPTFQRFYSGDTGEMALVDTVGAPGDYTTDPTTYPAGATSGFNADGYGPMAIVGDTGPTPVASWGILGDSIAESYTDTPTGGDDVTRTGWPARLLDETRGYMSMAKFGHTTQTVLDDPVRMAMLTAATHWIDALGRNEFGPAVTLADLQATHTELWAAVSAAGGRVIAVVPPPKTTSTDSWATTANQTLDADGGSAVYNAYCDWLLSLPYPTVGVIDARAACGIERAPGVWVWQPGYTSDGIHPDRIGHIAIATQAALSLARWEAF